VPFVPLQDRLSMQRIADGFHHATLRYGFMESPDIPLALMDVTDHGQACFEPMDTTYFSSRESVVARPNHGMALWRDKLFAFLHRNAVPDTDYFRIPGTRQVELGAPVEI
jgi:KUP system potassium uptake protein